MIKTENLTKTFRVSPVNPFGNKISSRALDGLSLEIGAGEILSITGRNGAGKTTLLKILATLVLPDSGTASVCGFDIATQSRQVRSKIGIVTGDERGFYWRLSGRQNLEVFGALSDMMPGELAAGISVATDTFSLCDFIDKPVRAYSAGMRQRLALARATLHKPEVLLLDEPTRSTDVAARTSFLKFIARSVVAEMGVTVLYATHDLEEAIALGGETIVIEKGRIEYRGRPDNARELKDIISAFAETGESFV